MKRYTIMVEHRADTYPKRIDVTVIDKYGVCCEDRGFSYGVEAYYTTKRDAHKAAKEFARATELYWPGEIIDTV